MSVFNAPVRVGDKAQDAVGSVVLSQSAVITFAQAGTVVNLFKIPKPYQILDIVPDVTAAFNSSGTDLLDIGKTGSAAFFADDIDIAAVGRKTGVQAALLANLVNTTDDGSVEQITGTYTQSVADASTGAVRISVRYTCTKIPVD